MQTERQRTQDKRLQTAALDCAQPSMKGDDIAQRLLHLAVQGILLADALPHTTAGRHLASQLLRSVTSCGANYEEARAAESRRDFIHKLAVARKEAQETRYWLRLAHEAHLLTADSLTPLLPQLESVCRILGKSIATARARAQEQTTLD